MLCLRTLSVDSFFFIFVGFEGLQYAKTAENSQKQPKTPIKSTYSNRVYLTLQKIFHKVAFQALVYFGRQCYFLALLNRQFKPMTHSKLLFLTSLGQFSLFLGKIWTTY